MIIEKFFRVLADSKTLLSIGSDGEFVLSLALFKMMESLQIQDIDGTIKTLKHELRGVEIASTPKPKLTEEPRRAEYKEEEVVTLPPPIIKKEKPLDKGAKQFQSLAEKIYDRNYDLGECFNTSITYSSFENNRLTWKSTASGENRTLLKNHWGLIRMFVQEVFGYETKIKNISKELP
jgi:DNA polymerase-3 subunit gamma/tau